jgi:uncharacterized membrane protein YccC
MLLHYLTPYLESQMPSLRLSPTARKFLYGQQLFWSIRITLGVALPALLLMLWSDLQVLPLALGSGAMLVGFLDTPGSPRIRHKEMGVCALVVTTSALLTAACLHNQPMLWLTVSALTVTGAYAMNFGIKAGQIGLNSVVTMALTLALRNTSHQTSLEFCSGIALGAVGYVYFSLAFCALLRQQMYRRALVDAVFATADQFRARASCYDPEQSGQQNHNTLLYSQNLLQQEHRQARNLIVAELSRLPLQAQARPELLRLFNLLTDLFDLIDLVVSAHTDFQLIRRSPASHGLSRQLHDLLLHGAETLQNIALAISINRRMLWTDTPRKHLRTLEQMLQQISEKPVNPALEETLRDSVARMQSMRRLLARMVRDLRSLRSSSEQELMQAQLCYQAPPPLLMRPASWLSGAAPRYALRLTLAILTAMAIVQYRGALHDNWIVLTVAIAMRPSFGFSQQRGIKRIIGTAIGCALAVGVLALTNDSPILILLALLSLLLSFGLVFLNYLASACFAALMLVLTYHFLHPESHVALLRVLDTLIGGGITLLISNAWPYWESQRIQPQSSALLEEMAAFLDSLKTLMPNAQQQYRDALATVRLRIATLSATLDNMRLEPAQTQLAPDKVHNLLLWGNVLIALGRRQALRKLGQGKDISLEDQSLDLAIEALRSASKEMTDPIDASAASQVSMHDCALQMQRLRQEIQSPHPG